MSTFTVQAFIANPEHPQRRLAIELLVDTGATYTLLPDEVVRHLGLATPWRRTAMLASGEDVTYAMGHVLMRLNGEEMPTIFLAGTSRVSGRDRSRHARRIRARGRSGPPATRPDPQGLALTA